MSDSLMSSPSKVPSRRRFISGVGKATLSATGVGNSTGAVASHATRWMPIG